MRLSPTERLILINQYEILNHLQPGVYEDHIKVLRNGFEFEIEDRLFNQIDEVGLSTDACGEVIQVLAMYDHLIISFEKLEDKKGLTDFDVTFRGFDSADQSEGRQWSYALHLVDDQKRFKTKANDLKGYVPMLPKYREALALWEQVKARRDDVSNRWLSAEEIKEIIAPISAR
jgi:uncharacterized protein YfbU (UPF0304 family)